MSTTMRSYVLPDEPLPLRLLNTLWAERGTLHDDLATPGEALAWFRANAFPTASVDPSDLDAVVQLRAAVRTCAAHVTDARDVVAADDRTPAPSAGPEELVSPQAAAASAVGAALTVINRHAARFPVGRLGLVGDEVRWQPAEPGSGVEDALCVIAAAATALFTGADASRLRACHGPRCVLFFVKDHPRRQWCTLACGNRARAARHYRRQQDEPETAITNTSPSGHLH